MNPEVIEGLIEQGQDRYEARLAAGQARLRRGDVAQAIAHLTKAIELAPDKTVAWQAMGEALSARGQLIEASQAFGQGIDVARRNGDQQAEKVMAVWQKRLARRPALPDPNAVFAAGRLLALPTETVYGLAAPIDRPDLIARVFELKQRPADHPLIVHVGSIEQARRCVSDWPPAAQELAQRFWPGPLTLVLPKSEIIDASITAGQTTVALRMPDHPLALRLLESAGVPFVAPSANPFTRLSPTRAEDVAKAFSSDEVTIVDGGPCQVGIESTILALDSIHKQARLLRPGMISDQAIVKTLPPDWSIVEPTTEGLRAPGQMAAHYRTRAPLRVEVVDDQATIEARSEELGAAAGSTLVRLPDDADLAARELYARMRAADQSQDAQAPGHELLLLIRKAQLTDPAWAGILNRLKKAATSWITPVS